MKVNIGDKVLVTTDNWFYAPDGRSYHAAHGTVHGIYDDKGTLGIATNRHSTNWFIQVGNTTIAGCQIHYVVKSDTCNFDSVKIREGDKTVQASHIYNADGGH